MSPAAAVSVNVGSNEGWSSAFERRVTVRTRQRFHDLPLGSLRDCGGSLLRINSDDPSRADHAEPEELVQVGDDGVPAAICFVVLIRGVC